MANTDLAGSDPRMSPRYDSGAAAFYLFSYASHHGWRPLIGLGVAFFVYYAVVLAAVLWGMWPIMAYAFTSPGGDPGPELFALYVQRFLPMIGLVMVVSIVCWAVIEAALLRWLYGRGAGLRFGGAELRLILIYILWMLLPLAVFALPAILAVVAGVTGSGLVIALCVLAFVAAFFALIFLAVRLAPAGALTVHDDRLHVFSAWDVSRGRFWPVLGAFAIVIVIYFGASVAAQIVANVFFIVGGMASLVALSTPDAPPPDPEIIARLFTSPVILAGIAIYLLILSAVAFLFQAMLAGVNTYGVKLTRGEA
jgi:hypothetical protein